MWGVEVIVILNGVNGFVFDGIGVSVVVIDFGVDLIYFFFKELDGGMVVVCSLKLVCLDEFM